MIVEVVRVRDVDCDIYGTKYNICNDMKYIVYYIYPSWFRDFPNSITFMGLVVGIISVLLVPSLLLCLWTNLTASEYLMGTKIR